MNEYPRARLFYTRHAQWRSQPHCRSLAEAPAAVSFCSTLFSTTFVSLSLITLCSLPLVAFRLFANLSTCIHVTCAYNFFSSFTASYVICKFSRCYYAANIQREGCWSVVTPFILRKRFLEHSWIWGGRAGANVGQLLTQRTSRNMFNNLVV